MRTYEGAYGDESDRFRLLDGARLCGEVDDDKTTVHGSRYRHFISCVRVAIDAARWHQDSRRYCVLDMRHTHVQTFKLSFVLSL